MPTRHGRSCRGSLSSHRFLLPSPYRVLGDVVGRGTAVAVSGVSVGILGLILTQLGGGATFVGFIVGLIGVGISFSGVFDGVTCTLDEVDQETESVKVTIEGPSINYPSVEDALRELGAVIHSVDLVASGKRAVEDVRTGQDHR